MGKMSEFKNTEDIEKILNKPFIQSNEEIKKNIEEKVDEIIDDVIKEEKYTRIEIIEEENTNNKQEPCIVKKDENGKWNATIVPVEEVKDPVENIKLVTTEKEEVTE